MGMPLGQYLLAQGAITSSQLQMALEAQILYGGRLGYNLVDLGYLNPLALTQHLSDYFGVPAADPKQIGHVRPDALRAIPREVAVRYSILPLSLDRGGVTVAMSDPTNFKAIDEIAFATGRSVKVRTMPDFLIKKGLEAHYDVPTFAEFYRPAGFEKLAKVRSGAKAEKSNLSLEADPNVDFGEFSQEDTELHSPDEARWIRPAPPDETRILALRLAAALRPRDVGEALLAYTHSWFERVALFRLHGGRLRGWLASGPDIDVKRLGHVVIPVAAGLVEDALTQHALVHQEPSDSVADGVILDALGGARPRTVLVAPLFPRRGGVTVLWADNGEGNRALAPEQATQIAPLERALRKAEVALELAVVRRWLLWF